MPSASSRGGDRHRDADRRLRHRARPHRERPVQQRRQARRELLGAGDDAWDRGWRMPLWEDYQERLESNFADIANIGGRAGGSITAACFLRASRASTLGAPRHRRHRLEGRRREGRDRPAGADARDVALVAGSRGVSGSADCCRTRQSRERVTTIDFFTNAAEPLKLAARIIAKAYRHNGSVRVLTPDAATTSALDRLLWLEPAQAFLPHCRMDSPIGERDADLDRRDADARRARIGARQFASRAAAVFQPLRAPGRSGWRRRGQTRGRPRALPLLPRARLRVEAARLVAARLARRRCRPPASFSTRPTR